jgi:hypothetical protein
MILDPRALERLGDLLVEIATRELKKQNATDQVASREDFKPSGCGGTDYDHRTRTDAPSQR